MASRGWENVSIHAIRQRVATQKPNASGAPDLQNESALSLSPARSKYRNVKTRIDGVLFDSKKEADCWLALRAREQTGEIHSLRRQVVYPLCCPAPDGRQVVVANYIADFTFEEDGRLHIVDVKGMKTKLYLLKRKWLQLQDNFVVEEV